MRRVAIMGAAGRMGQILIRFAGEMKDVEVVAAIEAEGHPLLGQDAGVVAGRPAIDVVLTSDVTATGVADVLIDFTFHSVVPGHATLAADNGQDIVIGATGLDDAETAIVHAAAERTGVVWAPNMSLGINMLSAMVRQAAASLGMGYDIEIVETHHRLKKDAPSGTALMLAEDAAAGREQVLRDVATHGRHGVIGERPAGEIGIHAVRAGDVVGDHTVTFASDGERLEFTHRASSRECFARGALQAAVWLEGRGGGLFDMQDVLGLKPAE
jgi:4-hydroxy-tetrahydrodipicolinate reductase